MCTLGGGPDIGRAFSKPEHVSLALFELTTTPELPQNTSQAGLAKLRAQGCSEFSRSNFPRTTRSEGERRASMVWSTAGHGKAQ